MQMPALVPVLRDCVVAAVIAVAGAAGRSRSRAADLVAALRQGGYVIVMRHANSPQSRPDATTAAPATRGLERQLNENGHKTAHGHGRRIEGSADSDRRRAVEPDLPDA